MKIGIITHYDVHNHGAQLQLYALEKVIEEQGHFGKALTFNKKYDFLENNLENKYKISMKSIPYYLGYLKKFGIKRTFFNIKKKVILEKFKSEKSMLGQSTSEASNLDMVIIGSDEVFSIEAGLTPEFFGKNIACDNIVSYAACFGPTDLELIQKRNAIEFIKSGINRLKEISVRDENSQMIIEKISEIKPEIVCDPVILYGYQEETKDMTRPFSAKFMLIYAYDNNMNDKAEVELIENYARKKGLQIISAGFYHKWCDKSINVTPIELLKYVKFAECVVTDTFHGTVMSIIMNTQFISKLRGNSNKLEYLLKEYNLIDRVIYSFEKMDTVFNQKIDFSKVNETIEFKRKKSMDFLKKCLESKCNE